MNIGIHDKVDKEDKPLTRTDVERFFLEAGSSDKLNLSGRNLEEINPTRFILQGAKLSRAYIAVANLTVANLENANLSTAIVIAEQLDKAKSLKGSTMPDGSKHL